MGSYSITWYTTQVYASRFNSSQTDWYSIYLRMDTGRVDPRVGSGRVAGQIQGKFGESGLKCVIYQSS